MSKVLVTESSLARIAAAIRAKNGSSDTYKPGQMAEAIAEIPTGTTPSGTIDITQNGTADVTNYASANVNVPNSYAAGDEGKVVSNGALVAQTARSSEITANGTYDTTLNDEVTVNVSGGGGGGAEPSLPSAYQEVEYLVSDGAEWITSDLPMVKGDIISLKFEVLSRVEQTAIGNRSASAARWDAGWQNGSFYANNACYNITSIPDSASNIWEALIAITTATSTGFNYGSYLYSTKYPSHGRLYTLRIFRAQRNSDGTVSVALTAKYVPCYRKSDDVIGFYDVVNEAFYTNSGSGQFDKGGDVT